MNPKQKTQNFSQNSEIFLKTQFSGKFTCDLTRISVEKKSLGYMGKFLGLPEVLETDDEDENHLGLAWPKNMLWFVCNLV